MKSNAPAHVPGFPTKADPKIHFKSALILACFLCFAYSSATQAQECPEELFYYDPGGQAAGSVDIKDNLLAFGGSLTGLNLMDISDPAQPQLQSNIMRFSIPPCGSGVPEIFDVGFKDNLLFATYACPIYRDGGYSGIIVYDVTDPTNPSVAGNYYTVLGNSMAYCDMEIYGAYAFLAMQWGGLAVFDISDAAAPSQIWNDELIGNITRILMQYPWLYALRDRGVYGGDLLIYDVGSLQEPKLKTVLAFEGSPQDIVTEGNWLYLLQWIENQQGDLLIYDAADPMDLKLLGEYILSDAVGMRLDVRRGIAGISATHVNDEWPYQSAKLIVLNCNVPSHIDLLAEMDNDPTYVDVGVPLGDSKFKEKYLFISGNEGLKIFDLSDCFPGHLRPVTRP